MSYKVTKTTNQGTRLHKGDLGTERSAKMVLDDLKNTHLKCGHSVYYHGDSISVSGGSEVFICSYKIEQQ